MSKQLKKLLYIGLILNILLTIIKLTFGYIGNSISLVSDGYNSLTDILISMMLIITIKLSYKSADHNHPYGHEKYEGITSLILGFILIVTAGMIFYSGIDTIVQLVNNQVIQKPSEVTIYAAITAIIIKGILFMINWFAYKKYKQASLKAERYNHLTDIAATTTSLIGIFLTQLDFVYFDALASIIIGMFVTKTAYNILKEAVSFLVDEAAPEDTAADIKKTITQIAGVIRIDDFKSRMHVNRIYVDVEIAVSKKLSLSEAHKIAEAVHLKVEKEHQDVIHCMVHVNPAEA